MSYTLLGSQTSPFVRRIRMIMETVPYTFKEMNIFEGQDAIDINKINPVNQIPVLLDGEKPIWDSRQIFNYLNLMHKLDGLNQDDENLLTAVEGAMSSGINLLLMKRSGMSITEPFMFVNRQKERIESVLDWLTPYIKDEALSEWNFKTMTIYSFLDWGTFRGIVNLDNRPEFQAFMKAHSERPIVLATAIPKV